MTACSENMQEKYADNPGFRPYLLEVPFPEGKKAKGAVILASGGAHLCRSNVEEAFPSYVPDETDQVSGQVNACLVIYGGSPEKLSNADFPPTFFAAGRKDEFRDIVRGSAEKICRPWALLEVHTFAGVPHGFGAGTHADGTLYKNAAMWPALADAFLDDLYGTEK